MPGNGRCTRRHRRDNQLQRQRTDRDTRSWAAGDLETARERQNFSQEVINVICRYRGNIVGGKRIMKLIGLDLGKNRTPFQNMTDAEETAMKAELEAIHFFDRCNKF